MKTFSFTFTLDRFVDDLDEIDAFYGRCSDVAIESAGMTTFVHFDRDAESLDEALRSAIDDLNAAGFHVTNVEVESEETVSQI